MIMKSIEVPAYVAEKFNHPPTHPSQKPGAIEKSNQRVYRLIDEALKGVDWPDWEVDGRAFHSPNGNEPYGFEFVNGKFYIYAEERGQRSALAIFKSAYLAADYFVWLASEGKRKIDWQLYLEMEP